MPGPTFCPILVPASCFPSSLGLQSVLGAGMTRKVIVTSRPPTRPRSRFIGCGHHGSRGVPGLLTCPQCRQSPSPPRPQCVPTPPTLSPPRPHSVPVLPGTGHRAGCTLRPEPTTTSASTFSGRPPAQILAAPGPVSPRVPRGPGLEGRSRRRAEHPPSPAARRAAGTHSPQDPRSSMSGNARCLSLSPSPSEGSWVSRCLKLSPSPSEGSRVSWQH